VVSYPHAGRVRPGDDLDQIMSANAKTIRIDDIRPNPAQPRRLFGERALARLASTMRRHGLLQPVVVRRVPGRSGYELVAGERRLRAARRLGWKSIPATLVRAADRESAEMALIENEMRENLNPLDVGLALKRRLDAGETYRGLAASLGKGKSYVQNRVRLLGMQADIRALVRRRPDMLLHAYELSRVRDARLRLYLIGKCRGASLGEMTLSRLRREMRYGPQRIGTNDDQDEEARFALWHCSHVRDPDDGDEMFLGSCHPSIVERCLRRISGNTLRRTMPPFTLWLPFAGSGTGIVTARKMGVSKVVATDVVPMARGVVKADARRSGLPDGSVDAIFAHPPYWKAIKYSRVYGRRPHPADISLAPTLEEYLAAMDEFYAEAFRVLRPGGRMYVLIADIRKRNKLVPLTAHLTLLGARRFELVQRVTVVRSKSTPLMPLLKSNARRRDHLIDLTDQVLFFQKA
jgi:ParB family chromosome partitioning protein